MRFKCFTCGEEFDDIQQLANHKRMHQNTPERKSGVTCLGCAKQIPLQPEQMNYSGPLKCPTCKRTMSVKLEGGEVVFARLG